MGQAVGVDNLEAAVAYGRTVPEAFGGAWWAGHRLQVAFTVLEPHRTALMPLLSPDAPLSI